MTTLLTVLVVCVTVLCLASLLVARQYLPSDDDEVTECRRLLDPDLRAGDTLTDAVRRVVRERDQLRGDVVKTLPLPSRRDEMLQAIEQFGEVASEAGAPYVDPEPDPEQEERRWVKIWKHELARAEEAENEGNWATAKLAREQAAAARQKANELASENGVRRARDKSRARRHAARERVFGRIAEQTKMRSSS